MTVDTIVVGAGTAGAVVAGRLAAGSSGRTLLLEAGPDYGPADSGRWPHDVLDAASSPLWSHDWGYTGEFGGQVVHFNRARVVGGCSAHNACAVVFGSRLDYDGWAAAGNPGWSARELVPLFALAWKQLRVRRVGLDELTPFQRICRNAIVANGIPAVEDFNNLDQNAGVAPFPVNIDGATRINSAFGYVDPVRDRLVVAGDAPVERVLIRGGRVAGVAVRDGQQLAEIGAPRVVLCAGAYGSPAILLRSGIGPAGELIAIGLKPTLDLPGVGRNLHDQPCLDVGYEGSGDLIQQMERHQAATGWQPHEQVLAKFPSAGCRQGFDLHIYPVGGRVKDTSQWFWILGVACLTPLSRGSVRLTGPGLDDQLVIDHRYLSDSGGYDRARLAEGVERVREVAQVPELRRLLGRETRPGPDVSGRQAIRRFLDHAAVHYYHPAGSCKMGPPGDPDSVADSQGRVHGIEGLYVADASLMPAVTSGNTNMPTTVIGERIARSLLGLAQPLADGSVAPRVPHTDSRLKTGGEVKAGLGGDHARLGEHRADLSRIGALDWPRASSPARMRSASSRRRSPGGSAAGSITGGAAWRPRPAAGPRGSRMSRVRSPTRSGRRVPGGARERTGRCPTRRLSRPRRPQTGPRSESPVIHRPQLAVGHPPPLASPAAIARAIQESSAAQRMTT